MAGESKEETSPSFGGNGGGPYTWKVPDGQYIAKIEYRQGSWLDGLTFVTNKGNKSPHFGGNGGNGPFTYTIPSGQRLSGIYGHKDQYMRGVGFFLTPQTSKTIEKLLDYGNIRGTKFEWVASNKNADLKKIEGEEGWYIDQIQFTLTSG